MSKTAMVSPPPAKPDEHLLLIIEKYAAGRPYTVIRKHKNAYKILFAGDYDPSVFRFVNGEPVLEGGDPG